MTRTPWFLQPDTRVLISGDALWPERVAIIFPELLGEPGFGAALKALDLIESLRPVVVIPGHGAAFDDVQAAWAHAVPMLCQADTGWADQTLDRLLADGVLVRRGDWIISPN